MANHRYTDQLGRGGNFSTWWFIRALIDAYEAIHGANSCVVASGSGTGGRDLITGVDPGPNFNVFDPTNNPYYYTDPAGTAKLNTGDGTEPWCSAPRAWIVLKLLGAGQIVLQHSSTGSDAGDASWNWGYAPGSWSLAGCNANTCPVDATVPGQYRWLRGSANGAGSAVLSAGSIVTRTSAMARDVASSAGAYSAIVEEIEPANAHGGIMAIDALTSAKCDIFRNVHSKVFWATNQTTTFNSMTYMSPASAVGAGAGDYPQALLDFGGGTVSWDTVSYCPVLENASGAYLTLYPGQAGAPAAGQNDVAPQVSSRLHGGWIGFSDLFRWAATLRPYPDQDNNQYGFYHTNVFFHEITGDSVAGGAAVSAVP